jgi:hypothetical protein
VLLTVLCEHLLGKYFIFISISERVYFIDERENGQEK